MGRLRVLELVGQGEMMDLKKYLAEKDAINKQIARRTAAADRTTQYWKLIYQLEAKYKMVDITFVHPDDPPVIPEGGAILITLDEH